MEHYINKKCPSCSKETSLIVTDEQLSLYSTYLTSNQLIQNVFPDFDVFKREFLITGYCIKCQSKLFLKKLPKDLSEWRL